MFLLQKLVVALILLLQHSRGADLPEPSFYFSMDLPEDDVIRADIVSDSLTGEFDVNNAAVTVVEGISGSAIRVAPGKKFDMIESLKRQCFHDVARCSGDPRGFTYTFWLRVTEVMDRNYQNIISTTPAAAASDPLAGFYFGIVEPDYPVYVYLASTTTRYTLKFDRHKIRDNFTMVAVTWSEANGLNVAIDGEILGDSDLLERDTVADSAIVGLTDLEIGGNAGPAFDLDEFRIYYTELTQAQLTELYYADKGVAPPEPTMKPTEPSSTTTTTSINNTTSTTTTTEKPDTVPTMKPAPNATEPTRPEPTESTTTTESPVPPSGCTTELEEYHELVRAYKEQMSMYKCVIDEYKREMGDDFDDCALP